MACGIFSDQGSNPCPLHWQADTSPLSHQGSPSLQFLPCGEGFSHELILKNQMYISSEFLFSSCISFSNLCFSRGLSIFSVCQIYWHKVVYNIPLFYFNVYRICDDILSLIPNIHSLFLFSLSLFLFP